MARVRYHPGNWRIVMLAFLLSTFDAINQRARHMSYGVRFTDSEGNVLELRGSWRLQMNPPKLIGEGVEIDVPPSIFNLDFQLSPEQLDEIRRQVPASQS